MTLKEPELKKYTRGKGKKKSSYKQRVWQSPNVLVCTCHRPTQNGGGTHTYIQLCTSVYANCRVARLARL